MTRSFLILSVLLLLSCSSGEDTDTDADPLQGATIKSSPAQVEAIGEMLREGVRIERAVAVESDHHERAYWVGTRLQGEALQEPQGAVWLVSGDRNTPGMILAASPFAEEMSVGPSARETEAWSSDMLTVVNALRTHLEDAGGTR
jgi:hypothetical protein